MQFTEQERKSIAPMGILRSTINLGNPILARQEPGMDHPEGVSVDLARSLAALLGLELRLLVFDGAGKAVKAVAAQEADIGFFAIDPLRAEGIRFTSPYVLIEGAYMVRDASPIQRNEEIDRPGNRVVVGQGSAYDLFLTRELQQAQIERAPTSPAVVDVFLEGGFEVAAGVRQQLESDAARWPGLRVLPERFMVIEQAMGLPSTRDDAATGLLARFVEHAKQEGMVSAALRHHKITGARVAP
ncbi:transporter substrate-binding domain-containing protein [Paracidovorax anthurii]|uniref:Amino acid ABC transporter substrate-binding protein (PAAT family) n=1 Tax=Paracidovorax anthurii TaxID=78229 RepID=A0A328ZJL4_9BURK|nr:transporter substrate-binding domain-containing protein [Paracidovorax anthurii]RAR84812.1 amino acid ABC transporter substrate-binding protein (PAAT family) [Paracidovorax anthurii]